MIIVKGDLLNVKSFEEAKSILFVDDGAYSYVESGVVENEMRVCGNWKIANDIDKKEWIVGWRQGTEIPQELGDYLVTCFENQEKQTPNSTGETED